MRTRSSTLAKLPRGNLIRRALCLGAALGLIWSASASADEPCTFVAEGATATVTGEVLRGATCADLSDCRPVYFVRVNPPVCIGSSTGVSVVQFENFEVTPGTRANITGEMWPGGVPFEGQPTAIINPPGMHHRHDSDASMPLLGSWVALIAVAFFGLAIYFMPTSIAMGRKHQNVGALFALNLLLGWTLLGWVAALVWAFVRGPGSTPSGPALATKACPFCAESINAAAIKCKHCGSDLSAPAA